MGEPKLLLSWGETSILGHLLGQWRELGAGQIAVVCAADDVGIAAELDRLDFPSANRIVNPKADRGMFSSIQCAAESEAWQDSLTHWAIVLGDQPHLRASTLRSIADFSAANSEKICQPRKGAHRYHPVFLPKPAFMKLPRSTVQNLKDFLKDSDRAYCEINDPGLDLDIDHPEDYKRALKLAIEQSSR